MEEAFNLYSIFIPAIMMIEIYIVEFLLSFKLEKRSFFPLRFIGGGLISIYIVIILLVSYILLTGNDFEYGKNTTQIEESICNFVFYILIFFLACFIYYFSFNQSITQTLSCCSVAYSVQHLAKNSSEIFSLIPFLSNQYIVILINVLFFTIFCILMYFLFIRKHINLINYEKKNKSKLFISLFIVFICIGMSRLTSDVSGRNNITLIAEDIYSMVCCFLVLYVQFGIEENNNLHYEVDSILEVLHEEKKQFELSKDTIDLINLKCHDLKYQIAELRNNYSEKNLSSIEHSIMIYDCKVKTGNDVLDIILTEKKLQCENKKIDLTCSVKGKDLSFMDSIDIYTLFGNLLSNAIESVSKVQPIEKRCISLNIIDKEKMIFIHVENYFEGEILFENGFPVTEKNKNYHGFGMKSIQRIVNKYQGEISIITKNKSFIVDIFFPVQ